MENMESDRGGQTAGNQTGGRGEPQPRRGDRREEGGGLFTYQGPERRSGRDRRTTE